MSEVSGEFSLAEDFSYEEEIKVCLFQQQKNSQRFVEKYVDFWPQIAQKQGLVTVKHSSGTIMFWGWFSST